MTPTLSIRLARRHRGRLRRAAEGDVGAVTSRARVVGPHVAVRRRRRRARRATARAAPFTTRRSSCTRSTTSSSTTAREAPNEWDVTVASRGRCSRRSRWWRSIACGSADDAQSPAARQATSVAERDRILADLRARLAGDAETLGLFDAALRSSRLFLSGRERYKTNSIKIVGEIRMAVREVGRQMVAAGPLPRRPTTCSCCSPASSTSSQLHPDRFGARLADRYDQHRSLYDLEPPFVVNGSVAPISQWKRRAPTAKRRRPRPAPCSAVLQDRAASPPGDRPGDPRLRPIRLTSSLATCSSRRRPTRRGRRCSCRPAAVIVNVGAMGSHAMIVSPRAGHPLRRVRRERHRPDPQRRDRDRRRQRRHGDGPLN